MYTSFRLVIKEIKVSLQRAILSQSQGFLNVIDIVKCGITFTERRQVICARTGLSQFASI